MENKAENFDFMAIIMNRDLFSGTICQCGDGVVGVGLAVVEIFR